MRRLWGVGMAAALAILLGLGLAAAEAAPLFREDFEQGVGEKAAELAREKPDARGWRASAGGDVRGEEMEYLQYPAAGKINPDAGTVEFEVDRAEEGARLEAYFSLRDAQGKSILTAHVWWRDYRGLDDLPLLEVTLASGESPWYREVKHKYRGLQTHDAIPMGGVGGGRFHVAFTWGESPSDFGLYVNGKRLKAKFREESAEPFRQTIRSAEWIVIGAQPGNTYSRSQSRSVIKSVHVYDQPINVADLHANPEKYRVPAAVASVSHDAFLAAGFSGKLVAGNALTVTLAGTPGSAGTFDIAHYPDIDRKIALDWRGWGVYLEKKTFYEEGEVNLRDVEGYRVYAAKEPLDPAALTLKQVEGGPPPLEPVARLDVKEQAYTLEFLDIDTPYYVAVLAEMRDGTLRPVISPIANRPLAESAPGVYTGTYQVGYQDRYGRAVVVGRLAKGETVARAAGDAKSTFAVDPRLTVAVETEPKELKADEKSVSKVTVTVTDANGNAVAGHKVKFLLATTSQYTGVVGGGAFADQVGGSMKESAFGETDLFGRLTATYVAGFAAKTAVIVARDMASNDTGAGYVKTYIQAAAELELEPVVQSRAMMAEGYEITVTSSDAWLTADGRSQARITARVTLGGKAVEGHQVSFEASPGAGSIRVVQGRTDRGGEARAVFTAGRKIGIALITATDTTVNISGSVAIELRSDAPAKIRIKIDPEKLPADGRSSADLLVQVTDINDNPNDNVEVEYLITEGSGSLRDDKNTTDKNGESTTEYRAGRTPGTVTFGITVRSTVPTAEEMTKARDLALAVTDSRFF